MIRGRFLSEEDRNKLIALARDGSAVSRVTRRANALVLWDDGWSAQEVAAALLLNDDTIRGWFKLFEQRGIEGLTSFDVGGSASFLSAAQEDALKVFVSATLPRSTRQVGGWIEQEFGLVYESRSGLIALLHRLGLEYHKPDIIPRKLNKEKQQAFIEDYELGFSHSRCVSKCIFHALPDMARNFYAVSAWPRHERNLVMPDFATDSRDCIAECQDRFWIPCGGSRFEFL